MDVVTFSAATTTNGGSPCNANCLYAWDFGDGTTANGQTVTKQFRSQGSFQTRLTVTDARGATATGVQTVAVGPGAAFTSVTFTTSPANPGVNQDVFFNASSTTAAPGRTIQSYEWTFGDGNRGTGSMVVHRYEAGGSYQVQLTATDDAGTVGRFTQALQVGVVLGPTPVADLTASPAAPKPNQPVSFNASGSRPGTGANIVSYTFNWGDGSPEEVHTNPLQTHAYTSAGTFVATVTVRDSLGRTASDQVEVPVTP
jgi:PKD repeat protein